MILKFVAVWLLVGFLSACGGDGTGPGSAAPTQLKGQINLEASRLLFSNNGLPMDQAVASVTVYKLDGTEVATQGNPGNAFSLDVLPNSAYFLKAQTVEGVNLWALTPKVTGPTTQDIDLQSTYATALVYASGGGVPPLDTIDDLKQKADEALRQDFDRLKKAV